MKNTDCDQGFSKALKDYGNNISFEGCKIKCLLQSNCNDITWAPKTGRCITFTECEQETPNPDFQHYIRKGNDGSFIKHPNPIFRSFTSYRFIIIFIA